MLMTFPFRSSSGQYTLKKKKVDKNQNIYITLITLNKHFILDFKLSPCFDCSFFSFGKVPGVSVLMYAETFRNSLSVPSSKAVVEH